MKTEHYLNYFTRNTTLVRNKILQVLEVMQSQFLLRLVQNNLNI